MMQFIPTHPSENPHLADDAVHDAEIGQQPCGLENAVRTRTLQFLHIHRDSNPQTQL